MTQVNLSELLKTLQDAQEHYTDQVTAAQMARSRETTALNALNDAQKKFDEAYKAIKDGAPRSTNWANEKIIPVRCG